MIEITTFRLRLGVDAAVFRQSDRRLQQAFSYQQAGLLRRTVAVAKDGRWAVVELWRSHLDADDAARHRGNDPDAAAVDALIDPGTVVSARYDELDG